jgi:YfiH family protein
VIDTRIAHAESGEELPLLVSSIIPADFRHGFTTRAGGVSAPPFDSLNLGWRWGDDPAHVAENHRRLLAVSGAQAMCQLSQVHGTEILRVHAGEAVAGIATQRADGLVSDQVGLALSVHVADCTPILMACATTGACAALHAGWRGTVLGMARQGVRAMAEQSGCRPGDLRVALGPCIGPCCFEFLAAMPAAGDNGVIVSRLGRKPHIDLRRFQRLDLEAVGVPSENIDASAECTFCDPADRFFSFRRAGRATGQMVGFIARVP